MVHCKEYTRRSTPTPHGLAKTRQKLACRSLMDSVRMLLSNGVRHLEKHGNFASDPEQ